MTFRSTAEEMERLQLSDEDTDDLWDSPSKRGTRKVNRTPVKEESTTPPPISSHDGETLFDRQEAREAALRNELQTVRNINQVIESLLSSLDRAKGNMDTEHNQRLILNPNWQGAVQDVADLENEERLKQQAAERRERELQEQREAAARRAAEEEKRRTQAAARGTRGRVRSSGLGRTPSVSYSRTNPSATRTTSTATRGSTTTTTRRPVSGIARGPSVTRGRGRT
ncbi:unnamed protein product [Aspergillus oryzae]|uniref:DASH complex subunit DUO1 n=1 Tax=Aspergillus oryzae TaxID=5062 RepID=A0AAN5BQ92_ASPOZ|nr:unnamed protein product [Aspergillus oryzae]GMF85749.1 unnamed protein product [Aspergillus oryzae]GMG04558.1 unnamed protein product [Aspergillus oryzae]GMG27189.1 unnamed protein product [Aspergillus oryzae]